MSRINMPGAKILVLLLFLVLASDSGCVTPSGITRRWNVISNLSSYFTISSVVWLVVYTHLPYCAAKVVPLNTTLLNAIHSPSPSENNVDEHIEGAQHRDDQRGQLEALFRLRMGLSPEYSSDEIRTPNPAAVEYMKSLHSHHRNNWDKFTVSIGNQRRPLGVVTSIRSHPFQEKRSASLPSHYILEFTISNYERDKERIVAAELRFLINNQTTSTNSTNQSITLDPIQLHLYDVSHFGEDDLETLYNGNIETIKTIISRLPIENIFIINETGWISHHIQIDNNRLQNLSTNPVHRYLFNFVIDPPSEFKSSHRVKRAISYFDRLNSPPYLVTFHHNPTIQATANESNGPPITKRIKRSTKSRVLQRNRRDIWNRKRHFKHQDQLCRIHQMYVNYSLIKWSWILAPTGYHANMCMGDCPYPLSDAFSPTNHAIIQQLVSFSRPKETPPPCCVPTSFLSDSMLHFDNQNMPQVYTYPNMIVTKCSCR